MLVDGYDVYRVDDEIPTNGLSRRLRCVVFEGGSVRDKKITAIDRLERYEYSGKPLMNGRGFGLKVTIEESFAQFRQEFSVIKNFFELANFSNRYFS